MDKCLDRPTLTEGESSERPKMRVIKLVDVEQIYKVTPLCTIKEVERMSLDTHAPKTDSNMQKSIEEPSNKRKCKNDRRLSGDMKVRKSQNLSLSTSAKRVSETDEGKNKNEVGTTALKRTSTKNQRPASSFPYQKPEEHPTAGKTCHSSKATTREVKCKNYLTLNEVANERENEDRCFRRLRKLLSSEKTKPSENQVDVEGGNPAACDLQDSEKSLSENVEVAADVSCIKKTQGPVFTMLTEEKAHEAQFTEKELNGRKKVNSSLHTMRDGKFSSRLSKKRCSRRSDIQSGKFPKNMTPNVPLSGYHEEVREREGSIHIDATTGDYSEKLNLKEISDSLLAVGRHDSISVKGVDKVAMAEFEARNWKPSPPLFFSQPASFNLLLQIRGRTSLTASHADVSRDQQHHECHWPLSAISTRSTSAAMFEKFELQKTLAGVFKAFCSNPQESQVLARHNNTVSRDGRQSSLMAKNSIHDISQANSHAGSKSRLRLLGKDINLEDTIMTTSEACYSRNTHGYSHNITIHNMFGLKSSDGISIPTTSVAGPLKSLPISRMNDSMAMLPPPLVHNHSGSSHRPAPHEIVLLNNNYHGASGHPPPELAAAYLNNFSRSVVPSVPDDYWRHVNPSYFQHEAPQLGMTAFTSYAPPYGAFRSSEDPSPLISSSPAPRTSFVPSSSSAPSTSKYARA